MSLGKYKVLEQQNYEHNYINTYLVVMFSEQAPE